MNYYKIAKMAHCSQLDCQECEMYDYFKTHDFDTNTCKEKLIAELVKIIDKYKKFDTFLAAHGWLATREI